MILQALTEYYEAMAKKNEISKLGWCKAKVSFALNISKEGELLNIISLKNLKEKGKKKVEEAQILDVPAQLKRSGSNAPPYFLCDNTKYMLGLEINRDEAKATTKSIGCFELFKKYHKDILGDVGCYTSKSIIKFLDLWNPVNFDKNSTFMDALGNGIDGNLVFMIDGKLPYAQNDFDIANKWNRLQALTKDDIYGRCIVTGKFSNIARIHNSVKGISTDNPSPNGWTLVGVDKEAFESYGKTQGYNSPVGEYAAFAYTTALNKLLADREHKKIVGDTTIVYWSETGEKEYENVFNALGFGEETGLTDCDLDAVFTKIAKGEQIEINNVLLDGEKKFYVLGLAPNAARLSVRFFLVNKFGNFVANLKKHYDQLNIVKPSYDKWENLPLWVLLQETINKNSRNKAASPLLAGSVTRAVLAGMPYPALLMQSVLLRIRADQDDADKHAYKINRARAAIVKACLLRNYNLEEVITVSLNEQSSNTAYVLGRLFAVLEAVQEVANPGINTTIKNRYFNSACATPSVVFPILLKLSNHHLRKIERGLGVYYEKQIGELQNKIAMNEHPLPLHMRLEEQGIFILGYYHQTQKRYEKKGEK